MIMIRAANPADQETLGRLGAALMRQHHAADPRRFLMIEDAEDGYGRFLVSQLKNPKSQVLVAEERGAVVGYVFADVEMTDWMKLRGPCGVVQDLYVDDSVRRRGVGGMLLSSAIMWINMQGHSQVVLMTKDGNENAQRLFKSVGFRPTMVEMTLDAEPDAED